jgi:hypothetical protein
MTRCPFVCTEKTASGELALRDLDQTAINAERAEYEKHRFLPQTRRDTEARRIHPALFH